MGAQRIVLVKHALPSPDGSLAPRDWPLSDEGVTQAAELAGRLRAFAPFRLIASPERKATATAEIVAAAHSTSSAVVDGIEEIDRPAGEWMTEEEHRDFNARLFAERDVAVVGSEPADVALVRFTAALDAESDKTEGTLVAVSHGTVIALYVASSDPSVDAFELWKGLRCAEFVVLNADGRLVG